MLTKSKIRAVKNAWMQAQKAQETMQEKTDRLRLLITEATGTSGDVHYLAFNGFGFTPESGDNMYISINQLIQLLETGANIDEGAILEKLYFLPYQLPLVERQSDPPGT